MLKAGLIGIVSAVVAVAVVYFVGDAMSDSLLLTGADGADPTQVPLVVGLFSTAFFGAVGVGIAALCKRFLGNPVPVFVGVCIVGLIIFGIFPFTAAENTMTAIWLNIMHIAAAIPIVGSLVRAMQTSSES